MNPMLAEIIMFAGNFAPRGWAFCDGTLLSINSNQALFSLLGTTYGGDGRTTFALPDLRGRAPISPGRGPGLADYRLGARAGVEFNYLTVTQMPNHSHSAIGTIKASGVDGTTNNPNGKILAVGKVPVDRATVYEGNIYGDSANVNMSTDSVNITVGNTGANAPVSNMQPFLAINYIISLEGSFPSRS
tara:strand:- start:1835 stop:2398 length:564 start_codon:yes stop_codon:yes gene_type:complete